MNAHATADTTVRVAALFVHPLKSAAGIRVQELTLDERGAVGDRRWILADSNGAMITARETHRLVLIRPSFLTDDRHGGIRLTAPGLPPLDVPTEWINRAARTQTVRVWDDDVVAHDVGDIAAAWCSAAAGRACRLLRLADVDRRPLAPRFAGTIDAHARYVAMSDGAPLLLLGMASIDALNARLLESGHADVMDLRRFRANVLVAGTRPHDEDTWRDIRIGDVSLSVVSACTRCVLTTVDPDSAESGHEPLRAFAQYRRADGGVIFGMNTTHRAAGVIRIGDELQVLSLR
ncbi:MOSC domain-containing protein [Gemmatimonas groenlandica]|uniref:MOSC domain-containing protein n=1 Tax=Gemmatimonas groenlandica TaxID=2732249 RepID=A0A6M4IL31_9BACT|nr:MOSC N-terminal beta barrel domain-containing protein [Gemmatimonas groenlandica]QJR34589.1 MOSC domain-containing protein [Gemmatimonas groenlandica]